MKTPDEIKKGLECCKSNPTCSLCPYYNEDDCQVMEADALAYIQQLERERDAAYKRLEEIDRAKGCVTCAEYMPRHYTVKCTTCKRCSNWQWRGVQKEVE